MRVTEHGSGDNDAHDVKRQLSLQQAVDAISTARSDGFPVRSYNHWSFMDSYEWSSGYGPKFGLYSVDFASKGLERTPRESVAVFAAIAGAQAEIVASTLLCPLEATRIRLVTGELAVCATCGVCVCAYS